MQHVKCCQGESLSLKNSKGENIFILNTDKPAYYQSLQTPPRIFQCCHSFQSLVLDKEMQTHFKLK